ncbi:unnamed protein product [Amoebophrya sp. A25]|nr:unnamed protein product [Amoebophrya sp. A25]|eukprot:GSA25T00010800001.1
MESKQEQVNLHNARRKSVGVDSTNPPESRSFVCSQTVPAGLATTKTTSPPLQSNGPAHTTNSSSASSSSLGVKNTRKRAGACQGPEQETPNKSTKSRMVGVTIGASVESAGAAIQDSPCGEFFDLADDFDFDHWFDVDDDGDALDPDDTAGAEMSFLAWNLAGLTNRGTLRKYMREQQPIGEIYNEVRRANIKREELSLICSQVDSSQISAHPCSQPQLATSSSTRADVGAERPLPINHSNDSEASYGRGFNNVRHYLQGCTVSEDDSHTSSGGCAAGWRFKPDLQPRVADEEFACAVLTERPRLDAGDNLVQNTTSTRAGQRALWWAVSRKHDITQGRCPCMCVIPSMTFSISCTFKSKLGN